MFSSRATPMLTDSGSAPMLAQDNLVLQNYLASYQLKGKAKKKKVKKAVKAYPPISFMEMIKRLKYLPLPLEMIISYLGARCGPGVDVFVFRALNTYLNEIVGKGKGCQFHELQQTQGRSALVSTLCSLDLQKYMVKQDQMLQAYQNPAYGGPLIPDGPGIEVLAPRLHKSPLEQEAKAPPV
jgi:hypothetical protein